MYECDRLSLVDTCAQRYENRVKDVEVLLQKHFFSLLSLDEQPLIIYATDHLVTCYNALQYVPSDI